MDPGANNLPALTRWTGTFFAVPAGVTRRGLPLKAQFTLTWTRLRTHLGILAELGLIALWAIWVGRKFLNPDPTAWPYGREFGMAIQPHFVWQWLTTCGACILWDSGMNGGMPAFAESHSAVLHPLVIVTSLVFGVVNGVKVTLVAGLAMAGFAQWWIARVLGLGRIACLWSAILVVVAGHLAGRMENGLPALLLSTAACSLVIAPAIELARTGRRRTTVLLGTTLGLALLSGQGYLQIGLGTAVLPALILYVVTSRSRQRPVWRELLLAGLIAVLLAAILWVPLLHFWPNFKKDIDLTFSGSQPLQFLPLNLVISDTFFYLNRELGKLPYPYLYVNFIGWIPVLFASLALLLIPRTARRTVIFFLSSIGLIFLFASGVPFRWLAGAFPGLLDVMAGVRYPSLIAGLAVPVILALAAWGLDCLLRLSQFRSTARWPGRWRVSFKRLATSFALAILLIASLMAGYEFSTQWLVTIPMPPEIYQIVETMKSETAQWVSFPFGEHFWSPLALEGNLKMTAVVRPWTWKDRDWPPASLQGTRDPVDTASPNYLGTIDGVSLVSHPQNVYASVSADGQVIPCRAVAIGGDVDVDCETDHSGTLVVQENNWSGWFASRDGSPVDLADGVWLIVSAPAGRHHYEFRYRPADAAVGAVLTLSGITLATLLWFRSPPSRTV